MNRPSALHAAIAAIGVSLLAALAGCDALPVGYTPIKDIVAAPARFQDAEVKVKGTVTATLGVPLTPYRVFMLKDGTGEIPIVTKGSLPPADTQVALRGKVLNMALVADQPIGLRIEEIRRLD
jgi:hypothetical protein